MIRILLIQPNYRNIYRYANSKAATPIFPPMGLAYMASILKQNNMDVKIIEANASNLNYTQIKEAIEAEKDLEYIGITASTVLIEEANEIAKLCPPNIKVIVGGIHISSLPKETLEEFPDIDIAVIGEGEFTILEILKNIDFKKINGIAYRKGNKTIINPPRELIQDLDSIPFPAFESLPIEKYRSLTTKNKNIGYILTSRGCPYQCIFCADHIIHGKKFRYRSPENIIKEIELLMDKYDIKEFEILDDNFTLLKERVHKFCNLITEKRLKFLWRCTNGVRIDKLDYDLLKRMKETGCYMLSLGIESGNNEILKNIKKGITKEQVVEIVKLCNKVGIETRGLFMFGNLGEDEKTMQDTIDFAKELKLDAATFHITIPFPKTEYWEIIKKEGEMLPKKWVDYVAYDNVVFRHKAINDPEKLIKIQKRAYKEFYLRPGYLFNQIKKIKKPRDLSILYKGAKTVLKF